MSPTLFDILFNAHTDWSTPCIQTHEYIRGIIIYTVNSGCLAHAPMSLTYKELRTCLTNNDNPYPTHVTI